MTADKERFPLKMAWLKPGWYHLGKHMRFEEITIEPDDPQYDKFRAIYDGQIRSSHSAISPEESNKVS